MSNNFFRKEKSIRLIFFFFFIKGDLPEAKTSERKAVMGYALYKQAGDLFPERYDETVTKRWGIQLKVGSGVLSFSVLVPVTPEVQCKYIKKI